MGAMAFAGQAIAPMGRSYENCGRKAGRWRPAPVPHPQTA
jgi:hypothetical protein